MLTGAPLHAGAALRRSLGLLRVWSRTPLTTLALFTTVPPVFKVDYGGGCVPRAFSRTQILGTITAVSSTAPTSPSVIWRRAGSKRKLEVAADRPDPEAAAERGAA